MPKRKSDPRLTMTTMRVLSAFCEDPKSEMSGREVGQRVKLPSGTVYQILIRLREAGWLEDRWEEVSPHELGRPRRRYYRITSLGFQKTQDALNGVNKWFGEPAWVR